MIYKKINRKNYFDTKGVEFFPDVPINIILVLRSRKKRVLIKGQAVYNY